MPFKFLNILIIVSLVSSMVTPIPMAHADGFLGLPEPGAMVNLSSAYQPMLIKGLKVHPENPFRFDFIIDTGDESSQSIKPESQRLIKYFLTAMTIPERDLWVNLSPYEKNRMISLNLAQTTMGRDMLVQDYMLKQLTASLIYPERDLGRTFWDEVYTKARELYGTTEVPVNTFNKVWIVADRADLFERDNVAYVVGAHLKVMLEEDYLAVQKHHGQTNDSLNGKISQRENLSQNIIREIIIPQIEKEVNSGKNFASLRQMFYSMILASWYKMTLKDALLTQIYGNQSKVKVGVNQGDLRTNQEIFTRYLSAYKRGVFNFIKDDIDKASGETIPRKYFSGGFDVWRAISPRVVPDINQAILGQTEHEMMVTVNTFPVQDAAMNTEPARKDKFRGIFQDQKTVVWLARDSKERDVVRYSRIRFLVAKGAVEEGIIDGIKRNRPFVLLKPRILREIFNKGEMMMALDDDVVDTSDEYRPYITKARFEMEFPGRGDEIFNYLSHNGYFKFKKEKGRKIGDKGYPFEIEGETNASRRLALKLEFDVKNNEDIADKIIAMLAMAYKCQHVVLSANLIEGSAEFNNTIDTLPEHLQLKPEVPVSTGEFYILKVGDRVYVPFNHEDLLKGRLRLSFLGGGVLWGSNGLQRIREEISRTIHTTNGKNPEDARFTVQGGDLLKTLEHLHEYIEPDALIEVFQELNGETGTLPLGLVTELLSLNGYAPDVIKRALEEYQKHLDAAMLSKFFSRRSTKWQYEDSPTISVGPDIPSFSRKLANIANRFLGAKIQLIFRNNFIPINDFIILMMIVFKIERGDKVQIRVSGVDEIIAKGVMADIMEELVSDNSQLASSVIPPGGIDFNASKMHMDIQRDGAGIKMHFDQAMIDRIEAQGFDGLEFNIQSIAPVTNLRLFLGLSLLN